MSRDVFVKIREAAVEVERVETPHGDVFIRPMTAGEKDDLETESGKDGKLRARLLMLSVCDDVGHRSFHAADLPWLDEMPLNEVEPIVQAAIRLNRTSPADLEEMRKKSPSPNGDSSTD